MSKDKILDRLIALLSNLKPDEMIRFYRREEGIYIWVSVDDKNSQNIWHQDEGKQLESLINTIEKCKYVVDNILHKGGSDE